MHRLTITTTHSFAEPGTYYPALRATSRRDGGVTSLFGRVQNLVRVRVVVT